MTAHTHPAPQNPKSQARIRVTVTLRPDQDRWVSELLGDQGNVSGLVQALVDAAMSGEVSANKLLKNARNVDSITRAASYLKARESGMAFEEDVSESIAHWVAKNPGHQVARSVTHYIGTPFTADFNIARGDAQVACSILCKPSPRADRLQLALAESMIGQQATGRPVIVCVPYLLESSAEVAAQFKLLGYSLTDLAGLSQTLSKHSK